MTSKWKLRCAALGFGLLLLVAAKGALRVVGYGGARQDGSFGDSCLGTSEKTKQNHVAIFISSSDQRACAGLRWLGFFTVNATGDERSDPANGLGGGARPPTANRSTATRARTPCISESVFGCGPRPRWSIGPELEITELVRDPDLFWRIRPGSPEISVAGQIAGRTNATGFRGAPVEGGRLANDDAPAWVG